MKLDGDGDVPMWSSRSLIRDVFARHSDVGDFTLGGGLNCPMWQILALRRVMSDCA